MVSRRHKALWSVSGLLEEMALKQARSQVRDNRLPPLFSTKKDRESWEQHRRQIPIPRTALSNYSGTSCFLGVDSGSTTTKIIALGTGNQVLFSWYRNNDGNPIQAVVQGLAALRDEIRIHHPHLAIARTAVTGYGEDLIRTAFGMDIGLVETIAHFEAAKHMDPEVSFILDIGGQDMKAILFIMVRFAVSNSMKPARPGADHLLKPLPILWVTGSTALPNWPWKRHLPVIWVPGAPCSMNSRVKQALRENATISDISAGLSYAVVKNCLFKVLKLTGMAEMGTRIVLQGGACRNLSIVRALENLADVRVTCSDMPEMMGHSVRPWQRGNPLTSNRIIPWQRLQPFITWNPFLISIPARLCAADVKTCVR